MNNAPIVVFAFNRPEQLSATLSALRDNSGADKSLLYIFCDGPRKESDREGVRATRAIAKATQGFKSCEVIERNENWGLARSVTTGVQSVLDIHNRIVVLEDDLVTAPQFLNFMNSALDMYLEDEKVISISGYNLPLSGSLPETFFQKGADCWGWATWKRGWQHYNPDGSHLLKELIQKNLTYEFDYGGMYPFTKMLMEQSYGLINSWAIRWRASAFLKDMLTLYPGRSLVKNIGLQGKGTHFTPEQPYNRDLDNVSFELKYCDPIASHDMYVRISEFYQGLGSTTHPVLSPLFKSLRRKMGPFGEKLRIKLWQSQCEKRLTSKGL